MEVKAHWSRVTGLCVPAMGGLAVLHRHNEKLLSRLSLEGVRRVCYSASRRAEIILGPCIIEILEDLCMYWKMCLEIA